MFSINIYGFHKDKYYQKNFGNIKTFVKTAWENYGSTIDVELIGKLAQELSERLSYKDTIILEFRHDYTTQFPPLTIVENGNPNKIYLINEDLQYIKKWQKESYKFKNGKSAICIRQLNSEFDIWNTLKLIEYCITNEFDSNLRKSKYDYPYDDFDSKIDEISYFGMETELIRTITQSENSALLAELKEEKIEFYSDKNINGYYQNGLYCFDSSKLKFKTETLSYLTNLDKGVCIFNSIDTFVYLSDTVQNQKVHKLDSEGIYPFYSYGFNIIEHKQLDSGIFIRRAGRGMKGFVFSEENNEIIEVIEK